MPCRSDTRGLLECSEELSKLSWNLPVLPFQALTSSLAKESAQDCNWAGEGGCWCVPLCGCGGGFSFFSNSFIAGLSASQLLRLQLRGTAAA